MKARCGGCNRGIDLQAPNKPYDINTMCRLCWLYHNSEHHKALWQEAGDELPKRKQDRSKCRHREGEIDEQLCNSCAGTVKIKLFSCGLYERCTIAKPLEGIACCNTCKDFDESAARSR